MFKSISLISSNLVPPKPSLMASSKRCAMHQIKTSHGLFFSISAMTPVLSPLLTLAPSEQNPISFLVKSSIFASLKHSSIPCLMPVAAAPPSDALVFFYAEEVHFSLHFVRLTIWLWIKRENKEPLLFFHRIIGGSVK